VIRPRLGWITKYVGELEIFIVRIDEPKQISWMPIGDAARDMDIYTCLIDDKSACSESVEKSTATAGQ